MKKNSASSSFSAIQWPAKKLFKRKRVGATRAPAHNHPGPFSFLRAANIDTQTVPMGRTTKIATMKQT